MGDADSGSAADRVELLEAARLICRAEGITAFDLTSVEVVDGEVRVHILRGDGRSRLCIYPLSVLRGYAAALGAPPARDPGAGKTVWRR